MKITATEFKDLFILEPKILEDNRGFFFESFNSNALKKEGFNLTFVQDNQSFSKRNVLRGLHFQRPPFAQTKLVRVLSGAIQDVVVDLRKAEPTFGKYYSIELTSENRRQLLVPKGFAHGFLVLSESADVLYKCDEHYHPEVEGGLIYNDNRVGIKWNSAGDNIITSDKDLLYPSIASEVDFGF